MFQKWKLCFSSYSTCSRMPCIESTGAVGGNEWNGSKICKTRCGRWSAPQLNVQPGVIVHRPLIMRGCIKNSQKLDEHRFGASQVPHSLIWPIHPRHLFSNKMNRAYKFEIKKSRHTTFLYPATYTKHPIHVYPTPKQLRRRTLSSKLKIDHASHHKTEARSRPFDLLLLNISSAHWTPLESFMQSTNRSRLYLTQMDVARSWSTLSSSPSSPSSYSLIQLLTFPIW